MDLPFNAESPNRGPLAELVTRVVDVETRIRKLQAARSALFAEAHELAESEGLYCTNPVSDASAGARESHTAGTASDPGNSVVASGRDTADDVCDLARSRHNRKGVPRGTVTRRDRAHRVVRAELAAALHVSEWIVGHDISQAVELLTRCPALHAAQAR